MGKYEWYELRIPTKYSIANNFSRLSDNLKYRTIKYSFTEFFRNTFLVRKSLTTEYLMKNKESIAIELKEKEKITHAEFIEEFLKKSLYGK